MASESFHIGLNVSSGTNTIKLNFIVHAGIAEDKVITVGDNGDFSNLKTGLSNLVSGGTLIVLDGEYAGNDNFIGLTLPGSLQHPASGTESAFTTIMAQNPGQAILKDGAYVRLNGQWPVSYIAFKGLYIAWRGVFSFRLWSWAW